MNNEETFIAIITSFLAVSELLPFVKNTKGNGVLHTIMGVLLKICTVTLKGLKKENNNNVQKN